MAAVKKDSPSNLSLVSTPTSKVLDHPKAQISQPEVTISEPQIAHIAQESNAVSGQGHNNILSKIQSQEKLISKKTSNSSLNFGLPTLNNESKYEDFSKNSIPVSKNKINDSKKGNNSRSVNSQLELTDDFLDPLHSEASQPLVKLFPDQNSNPEASNTSLENNTHQPRLIGPGTPHKMNLNGDIGNSTIASNQTSKEPFSQRRNSDFHVLFSSLPIDDFLVADYACALQKGTLVQGRIYLAQKTLSFYSSFFGWTNKITIPLSEIVGIEKRHVAYVIPSAIQVATLHHKYLFTSFRNRDSVLIQLNTLWQEARLHSKSTEAEPCSVPEDSGESDYEEVNYLDKAEPEVQPERIPDSVKEVQKERIEGTDVPCVQIAQASKCLCDKTEHHDLSLEAHLDATPSLIYEYLYQNLDGWFKSFLNSGQSDVVINPWEGSTRKITYVKPLSNPLGPKSTRCIVTQNLKNDDLPNSVTIEDSVESLDVPSGSSFRALYRVCLTHNGRGGTQILVSGGISWLKSSWLKGPIERGVMEGHTQYFNEITASLETFLESRIGSNPITPTETSTLSPSRAARAAQSLARRRRVRRSVPNTKSETLFRCITSMIMTSFSMVWGYLVPAWQRSWDFNRRISQFVGNLSLAGLGVTVLIAIFYNWRYASQLNAQLSNLQIEHQSSHGDNLKDTLDNAVNDILLFATSLRRSVDALNQHIEVISTLTYDPIDDFEHAFTSQDSVNNQDQKCNKPRDFLN